MSLLFLPTSPSFLRVITPPLEKADDVVVVEVALTDDFLLLAELELELAAAEDSLEAKSNCFPSLPPFNDAFFPGPLGAVEDVDLVVDVDGGWR